jgi:hypothetical protein
MNPAASSLASEGGVLTVLLALFPLQLAAQPAPPPSASTNNAALTRDALHELTRPSRKLPFKEVIHATTGYRVLPFLTNNPAHAALRQKILQAASLAGRRSRAEGIPAERANEAGNGLERFIRAALQDVGLDARVPRNRDGRAQAVGYPDVEILGDAPCYLELKTYNAATVDTTQRSFYFSPGATPKVTRDAIHLLLAFELERQERDGSTRFVPVHWKLLTLEDLEVDLKFEFNQHNRGLYRDPKATLDQAPVE